MTVGSNGNGRLNITGGATATSPRGGTIGSRAGSDGRVLVDGHGSAWNLDSGLTVGLAGKAVLQVFNGARVTTSATLNVGIDGAIDFGSNGGTIEAQTFQGSP